MKKLLSDRIPFTKVVTLLTISLAISLGLCGVGIVASSSGNMTGLRGSILDWTFEAGVVAFWLSVLGLIVSLVLFLLLRRRDEARFRKSK